MIARIINYLGSQAGLLAATPNWDSEITVSLELPTDVSKEPITFNESRRNFAQSARYKMSWTSYLSSAADATELRLFLTRVRAEPILVPLWPDVCELQNAIVTGQTTFTLVDLPVRFGAGWIITNEAFTTWEILVVASLNLATRVMHLAGAGVSRAYPAGTRLYPLLLGRFDERPKPEAITDETLEVELAIKENSAFYARVTPALTAIQAIGPNIPEFATTPKWNVTPTHVRPLDWTEMPDVVYEHVGFLREEQQRVYDHRTPRGLELEFFQSDRASAAKIEYFWRDRRATTLRFMIPTYRGDLRMKYDTTTAVVDSYSETNTNNSAGVYTAARTRVAQSFTATVGPLIATKFRLQKVGSPTGFLRARLFSHNGTFGVSSVGNTLLATSDTVAATSISTSPSLVQFNFPLPRFELVATTNYVMAFEYVGGDVSNHIAIGFDDTGNHAGNFSQFTGGWIASATYDVPFYVYTLGRTIRCERSFFSNPGRAPEPGDPYIALINENDFVSPYKLSQAIDVQPDETRLVSTTNVAAHTAATTIVSHLLLARFAEPTLEWTYTTPYMGTTRIKFQELSMEYPNNIVPTPPPPLPEPAYLFIFKEEGIRTDRFTSYENTIVIASGTYAGTYVPAPFSFDSVKVGLKMDEEKLDFKSFKFTGNPLNKMWPFALDAILTLEIVECNAVTQAPGSCVTRFYGDVWSVDSDYKATAVPFGNLFDRKFPRFMLSVSDNYTQFSPPTKLTPSGFKITGTIHGVVNHTSQTLLVTSTAGHAKASEYFAGGWLETGTGVNKEKRGILHSAPASGSDVTFTIDRPLIKAANNQPLDMYPGYDASIDQCEDKFSNRINFGGHPYVPNVNPGVKAIKPKETQGGKKG